MGILGSIFGRGKERPIQGRVGITGSDRILSSGFFIGKDGTRQVEATEADLQGRPISQVIRIVEAGINVGPIEIEVKRVKGSR